MSIHGDSYVCVHCIGEQSLVQLMVKHASGTSCSYCDRSDVVSIDVATLAAHVAPVVDFFYRCSSSVTVYDGDPEGEPLYNVVAELIQPRSESMNAKLLNAIEEEIKECWYDDFLEVSTYGDDPWFVKREPSASYMKKNWSRMLQRLQHEARYVNPEVTETLDEVLGSLDEDRTKDGQSVITLVGPSHPIKAFYRARVFQSKAEVDKALRHPERELGPPPQGYASAGRMNARGVSVFYGANCEDVAVAEVRPPVGSFVLSGCFHLAKEMRLLDLTKFSTVAIPKNLRPFDEDAIQKHQRISFLQTLGEDLTRPVMPDGVEQGYLLTQVISDYLSTNKKLKLDGILFRSTQLPEVKGKRSFNVILFPRTSKVALTTRGDAQSMRGGWNYEAEDMDPDEYDEDGPDLNEDPGPFICIDSKSYPPIDLGQNFGGQYSLVLKRDSIFVNEIQWVEYKKNSREVASRVEDLGRFSIVPGFDEKLLATWPRFLFDGDL